MIKIGKIKDNPEENSQRISIWENWNCFWSGATEDNIMVRGFLMLFIGKRYGGEFPNLSLMFFCNDSLVLREIFGLTRALDSVTQLVSVEKIKLC
jgi:hypothetical protein